MNPHCDLCFELQRAADLHPGPHVRDWLVVHVRSGELAWWVGV